MTKTIIRVFMIVTLCAVASVGVAEATEDSFADVRKIAQIQIPGADGLHVTVNAYHYFNGNVIVLCNARATVDNPPTIVSLSCGPAPFVYFAHTDRYCSTGTTCIASTNYWTQEDASGCVWIYGVGTAQDQDYSQVTDQYPRTRSC